MLRYSPAIIVCLSALILVGGCGGPTNESLTKDFVAKMKEAVTVLKDVKDEASAKSGAEKLNAITADMKKIDAQLKTIGKPTAAEEKKLEDTYEKDLDASMKDYIEESVRIETSDEKISKPMEGALKDFDKAMEDLGKDAPK